MVPGDEGIFSAIYEKNLWGNAESVSGPGSTLRQTRLLRQTLPKAFRALGVRTLVDAPCGDFNWMRHLDYRFDLYIGVDIVSSLVDRMRAEFGGKNRRFQVGDLTADILPRADAVLVRDCFVHLPIKKIKAASENLRLAGFRYVFATTFTDRESNEDCRAEGWRTINMRATPLDWGDPIFTLNEGLPAPYSGKSIGVWATEQISAEL